MADYGIVMKIQTIDGNIALDGYKNNIGVVTMDFGGSAFRHGTAVQTTDSTTVHVESVGLLIHAGKWTAQLLNALYNVTDLGDVTLTQIAQAVDSQATAKPTVVQTFVLSNTHVTTCTQTMMGGGDERMATITLSFSHIVHTFGSKTSDFITKNFVAKAV